MINTSTFAKLENSSGVSQRTAALTAGIGLILMFFPAIFANFLVISNTVVPGDAAATTANVMANEMQFRLGILSIMIVIILDVIVAWALYVFFKPVNRDLSLLAGWFRLIYAAVFSAALFNLVDALRLITIAEPLTSSIETQILLALNAYSDQWAFALILFGVHLLLLGYLAFKASFVPKILAILVLIAGFGYVFDSVVGILFPDAGIAIGMFTFIGEMLLAIWLVVKGIRVKVWSQPAIAA